MSTITKSKEEKFKGHSERGTKAALVFTLRIDDDDPHVIDIDTIDIGGVSLSILIDASEANEDYTCSLEVSNNLTTKTEVPHKKLDDTEEASGDFAVTTGTTRDMIVPYGDYPLALSQRFFHLNITADTIPSPADVLKVYVCVK